MTVYDDNPLMGEVPDVPARSRVAAVLAAADKMSAAVQAIAEIRAMHAELGSCPQCRVTNPCPTITILERWGLR